MRKTQFYYSYIRPKWNHLRRRFDATMVEFVDEEAYRNKYHHSTFPHPLVTLDWDKEEKQLLGVEVVGKDLRIRSS